MPMSADEVAELSRLLDEAQALRPALREPWLAGLDRAKPQMAQRLRDMLRHSEAQDDDTVLPKLSTFDANDAIATAGERVGPYRLVREIGRGGMGSVWLAERADGTYKRRVALKLPRLTWSVGLAKRMARERDIGALLEHPNIARLYDAGVDEHGRPYIAMEYIDGQPIDVYCRERALDVRERLKLFLQVVQAVAYAHGRLVLHRDLKPSNVLVDAQGQALLLDFGIAKLLDDTTGADLTQEHGRAMTLSYAAPEHIAGRPLGVTADVYSLGAVLYELLTDTLPYARTSSTSDLERAILAGNAPRASARVFDKKRARQLRGDLDAILAKALKCDPAERYSTADALASDVQRLLSGDPIQARPDSAWYRLRKAVWRYRTTAAATSAVIAVALVGGTATFLQSRRAAEEAERAHLTTAFVSELFRVNTVDSKTSGPSQSMQMMLVDRGAQLIEARFADQPALKAEMYGVVSRAYADLGVDQLATGYAKLQRDALLAQKAPTLQVARSLMLLSETALLAERNPAAEEYAQRALDALRQQGDLLPEALTQLAFAQIRTGKLGEAEKRVAEAKRHLAEATAGSRSSALARLTYLEALLLSARNRFEDARPLFESAIRTAIESEGATSRTAFEVRLYLAQQLMFRERVTEGVEFGNQAVSALQGLGGVDGIRAAKAQAEIATLRFYMRQAKFETTIDELGRIAALLASKNAVPVEVLADIDFYRAVVLVAWGDFALAKPLLESSSPVILGSTQSLLRQFRVAAVNSECAIFMGDHKAAERFLQQRTDARRLLGTPDSPPAVYDWSLTALNLHMQGRHQEALSVLLQAPSFASRWQGDSVSDYAAVIPLTLARFYVDTGDAKAAHNALPSAFPRLDKDETLYDSYYQIRGEIRCAAGDREGGLADLSAALSMQSPRYSPSHPWIARMRAVTGLCALQAGHRDLAAQLADVARQAFSAQPNVSSYFKEPLTRLEAQLHQKFRT